MSENLRAHVPAIGPSALRAVDLVAHTQILQSFGTTIGHQDACMTGHAIAAGMAASPVGIDRVVERKAISGDVIDDRLGFDLDEGDCLLYTSDAADDLLCVDLGGR